ncbi:uncharacterized protein Hen1 isoform X6 [Cherax quadricarinatus]|uniref:uncharacterized protein Hen1 isoform X6 n=1 Tax=Cherax quadricarinatus TaxID=27406 RepID=UPI00387E8BF3
MDPSSKKNIIHGTSVSENGETTLCENRMLRQKIEDGSNGTLCIYDDSIIFSPPLYCQRYVKVMEMIISVSKGVFTKVVDIGCAGLKFFRYLKNVPGIQEILLLDKDFHILKDNEYRIKPLPADFLILRKLPLNVKAVCGDGRKYDPLLSETQVVTMIELCQGILQDNSDYSLETFGCGLGPENTYCTQMAVFLRSTSRQEDLFSCILKDDMTSDTFCHRFVSTESAVTSDIPNNGFCIVSEFDYPFDVRTQDEHDRDHTLARFYDLKAYICNSEQSSESYPVWEETPEVDLREETEDKTGQWKGEKNLEKSMIERKPEDIVERKVENGSDATCLNNLTLATLSLKNQLQEMSPHSYDNDDKDDNQKFFFKEYVKNEDAINHRAVAEQEYFFYIVDHKYAIIPMRSLSAWVNYSYEQEIQNSLIRLVVGDKCFETSGDGDEWQGKLQLWEESFSSDEYEDTEAKDQERWFTDAQSSSLDKTDYDDSDNIKTTVHLNEDWG